MPVLIIAVVFLVLFLIMGAMSLSAVISEHRLDRQVTEYKEATGIKKPSESIGFKPVAAGRR